MGRSFKYHRADFSQQSEDQPCGCAVARAKNNTIQRGIRRVGAKAKPDRGAVMAINDKFSGTDGLCGVAGPKRSGKGCRRYSQGCWPDLLCRRSRRLPMVLHRLVGDRRWSC
jgi:hypothetical protein